MIDDYPSARKRLQKRTAQLSRDLRGPMSAFTQLNAAAAAPGALDAKTKQLIALGISIASRCEGCIAYHLHDALRSGATRQEILEVLGISVMMGGGPAVVYACQALEALDQFSSAGPTTSD